MCGAVEDAVEIGKGEAIVGDGYAGFDGGHETGNEFLMGYDATATLDDEGIVFKIVGQRRSAGDDVALKVASGEFGEEVGQFDATDIFAGYVVGARFEEEYLVSVAEG